MEISSLDGHIRLANYLSLYIHGKNWSKYVQRYVAFPFAVGTQLVLLSLLLLQGVGFVANKRVYKNANDPRRNVPTRELDYGHGVLLKVKTHESTKG